MVKKTPGKGKKKDDKAAQDKPLIIAGPLPLQGWKAKREDLAEPPPPAWLVTFADATALMLTFFVLMYSMSAPEAEKWEEMTSALNSGFDKFKSAKFEAGAQDTIEIEKLSLDRALPLDYLQSVIHKLAADRQSLKGMVMFLEKDRLIISLPENLLFQSGQTEVNIDGKRALFAIGGKLSNIRNRIEVVGHTDPNPITNTEGRFASNRELSLGRALSVATILDKVGYERSVVIRGMDSARYEELSSALGEEKRLSLSRRVDIVILKDSGSSRSFLDMGSGL